MTTAGADDDDDAPALTETANVGDTGGAEGVEAARAGLESGLGGAEGITLAAATATAGITMSGAEGGDTNGTFGWLGWLGWLGWFGLFAEGPDVASLGVTGVDGTGGIGGIAVGRLTAGARADSDDLDVVEGLGLGVAWSGLAADVFAVAGEGGAGFVEVGLAETPAGFFSALGEGDTGVAGLAWVLLGRLDTSA